MTDTHEHTYVCMGSCEAVISEDQYKKGLTKCGAESCDMYQKPFVKGHKDPSGKTVQE